MRKIEPATFPVGTGTITPSHTGLDSLPSVENEGVEPSTSRMQI